MSARSFLSLASVLIAALSPAHAEVARPPQFVVMAFDNCTELERWQELNDFAADMNKDGERVHFTFFFSGVNLIADASRFLYEGPRQRRGYSPINFGGSADDVRRRVEHLNALNASGHEIASHAVGHFNGASWSATEWTREFRSFNDILDKVAGNNALPDTVRLAFPAQRVVGFRAPYLAAGSGLFGALKANGFRYDTSHTGEASRWPEKKDGLWRFNLADLKLHRSKRHTLSMDYNFFVVQAFGLDNSATRAPRSKTAMRSKAAKFTSRFIKRWRRTRTARGYTKNTQRISSISLSWTSVTAAVRGKIRRGARFSSISSLLTNLV